AVAGCGIVGAYESLITNTAADLQGIGNAWTNVTAPALARAITTHANPQPIVTALQNGIPRPVLTATGPLAQGYPGLIGDLLAPASLSMTPLTPPTASLAVGLGLPQLLVLDALGAPVNAGLAASASGTVVLNAVRNGDPLAAITAFVDAPATIA